MTNDTATPVYTKFMQILVGLVALFFILFIGRPIILPLVFATLIAILLNPLVNWLTRRRVGRVLSILLSLVLGMALVAGLLFFFISQASHFSEAMPLLREKTITLLQSGVAWVSERFNVDRSQVDAWLAKSKSAGMSSGMSVLSQTLGAVSSVLVTLLLLPVYTFLILFYKPLLMDFLRQLFQRDRHEVVAEVLLETKSLVQNYLLGLLIEAAIVAALNTTGLLLIGVPYAFLLGTLGALLNMIPYIGGIIAIALPVIMALVSLSPTAALLVIGAYMLVQFIDNNIIVPRIVASRVKLNALVSIVIVLVGGALWGVPGMFLSIPLTAIVKVIFDRIDYLKPWGFLLGDTMPPIGRTIFKMPSMPRGRKV